MIDVKRARHGVVRSTGDFAAGFSGQLVAVVWRVRTLDEDVALTTSLVCSVHEATQQLVGLIQIVPPEAVVPDGRMRKTLVKMLRGFEGRVSNSAVIQLGSGFRAAIVRSVVTGLAALSTPSYPHRVFATLREAASWMHEGHDRIPATSVIRLGEDLLAKPPF